MGHGEVADIVKDLKKVVKPASIISDEWLAESMTEYNKRRFEIVSGDSSKVICCPQAEVEPNSVASGAGSVYVSPQGQIAIVISFKNLNPPNYWTGGWQSEWTLSVAKTGKTKLEGRIRINVHYFEEGNVQLNSTFNEQAEVDVADPEATAKAVIAAISSLETDFQKKLDQFYVQMHDSTFKNMRRFLPKTGKKMDWRARTHNLVSEAASK